MRLKTLLATTVVVASPIVISGCSDDPTTPKPPRTPRLPTMVIVSGNGQQSEVATMLPAPLVVRVADSLGVPAARVIVHFSGFGTLEDSTTTDSQGLAVVSWTLGTEAITQPIVARAVVYPQILGGSLTVTFNAIAVAGAPARVAATGGDGGLAAPSTKTDTVTVVASDRFGNLSGGASVAWLVTAGGGSIRPIGTKTDAAGAAQAIWTMGPSEGVNTLDVTIGNVTRRFSATATTTLSATMVVVGDAHSCALAKSGAAYCWGSNSSGQLGVRRVDDDIHNTPQRVAGGLSFETLVAGSNHTCGLTAEGKAYCWGNGRSGQVGVASVGLVTSPAPVAGSGTFSALAAGAQHTCGLTTAKTALCWGDNSVGQLGDASIRTFGTVGGSVPVPIAVFATDGGTYDAISAGSNTTCAISTNGGTYCWGANSARELGGNFSGRCYVVTTQFIYDPTPLPCSTEPSRLPVSQRLGSLSAGGSGWCGATTGGELLCWGNSLLQPQVIGAAQVKQAWVLGNDVCALQTGDVVTCRGVWNQVGLPIVRPFGEQLQLGGLTRRNAHSCGVSRDERGIVYCWGDNVSGQLGDGTNNSRVLPVAVLSPRVN